MNAHFLVNLALTTEIFAEIRAKKYILAMRMDTHGNSGKTAGSNRYL